MKRATFYKVALSASVTGVGVAIALWSCWRLLNIFDSDLWTWLYPASLMLMAADGVSRGAGIVILVLSIITNAGLYFIVASIFCCVVAGFRRGLHD
jgi:hypothetical protein